MIVEEIKTIKRVFGDCKMPFWINLTIEDEYYNIPKLRSAEEKIQKISRKQLDAKDLKVEDIQK